MDEGWGKIPKRWTYDVFLSFCGRDGRQGFVSHLYQNLENSGNYTFKDDKELERGETFSPELFKAIENSKVLVVVLSENYASSAWCLDELLHIMECRKNNPEHVVLPIFHYTKVSDVRRKRGSYGAYLDKHTTRYSKDKLQKWKDALEEVTTIMGFTTENNRDDAALIQEITREIRRKVSVSYLQLPSYPVGIRPRVKRIYELMSFGSDDVQIIGICGMGGIGKTTLAKAAYNEISDRFEGTCFLENFGEYSKKLDGKVYLQRKLLSDILRRHNVVENNMDNEVRQRFRNKSVLVVIDDVQDMKQLNSVAIDWSCFGPGSRIIITSKNQHLLKQLGIRNIFIPEPLNGDESQELVSRHAFRTLEPPKAYLQLSEQLVKYCGGLPLAVEVVSASLYDRNEIEWKNTLEILKQIPDANIQAKLQVSFDALNLVEKDIFLDISCFFIEMDKDYVSCILDGCKFYPEKGLTVLKERCLITVRDNRLLMHDLLRDMGRQIVRGTSWNNCERWSRLWDPDGVIDVLENHDGTDAIEGLSLKAHTIVDNLEVKAFSNLRRLRLLQLSKVSLNGSYEDFPRGLRWLCWFEFPLNSIPKNMHLGRLAVMDLQYSKLIRLWDDQEVKPELSNLKYLDLSHSLDLTDTPDFSNLPNLEKLLLINCQRLVRVHKSIGTLHNKLVKINLRGCTELCDLPLEFYTLTSLETLILSGCSQLKRLDDALGEMISLRTIHADYTALTHFPSSTVRLSNLQELSLNGCKGLWKAIDNTHSVESHQAGISIPLSLNGLSCLKILRLESCNLSDELVPNDLGSLSCLEELDLGGNNFFNLQIKLDDLKGLQIIRLDSCSELRSMPILPKRLRSLYASNCITLEKTADLSECSMLQRLHLTNCSSLVETPGLDKLKTVGVIHMEMCNNIPATYRERIMQGWAVGANGGVFVPGSNLPNWVSFKNETRCISFTVKFDLVGFTLWTPYMSEQNDVMSTYSPKITVKNQTKGDVWSRNPAADPICMYREKHIWQGHFSNEDFFLETGDQVEVSVDFGDEVTILETGLTLTYKKEVTDISDKDTSNIGFDEQSTQTEEVYVGSGDEVTFPETGVTLAYRKENTVTSDIATSYIGYGEIPDEQLIQTNEVEDELVIKENQSRRPRRKTRRGVKKLVSLFCLSAVIM